MRRAVVLLCLALTACGSSPPRELQRTTGEPTAVVPVPSGFEDSSGDPPPQISAGVGDGELLHYFTAGAGRGGLPIHVTVSTAERPELLPAEAVAARQAATTVDVLAELDARASTPSSTELAGVPAARYAVLLRAENGARIYQQFVVAKRPGERLVHTAMLTAPSPGLFRRHLPAFDAMLARWRWND